MNNRATQIKILIVDDHEVVRRGIAGLLADAPDIKVLAAVASGEEALQLMRQTGPDVILMDMFLPGIDGLEATNKMLRIDPEIKILIFSTSDNEILSAKLLDEGIAGYLTKDCGISEVMKAIRMVYAGRRYLTPVVAQKLALKRHAKDTENAPFDCLSKRELQIVMRIIHGDSVQEVADALILSPKTISTHRHRLFKKLDVKNDVELTILAIRHGLLDIDG